LEVERVVGDEEERKEGKDSLASSKLARATAEAVSNETLFRPFFNTFSRRLGS